MIPLGFLILSTAFVITLIMSIMKLLNTDWDKEGFSGRAVIDLFKWPLILFVLFILFIAYGIPYFEAR